MSAAAGYGGRVCNIQLYIYIYIAAGNAAKTSAESIVNWIFRVLPESVEYVVVFQRLLYPFLYSILFLKCLRAGSLSSVCILRVYLVIKGIGLF